MQVHGLLGAAVLQVLAGARSRAQVLNRLLVLLALDGVEEPGDQEERGGDHQTHIGHGHGADVVLSGYFEVVLPVQLQMR